jgi:hypothetical protein
MSGRYPSRVVAATRRFLGTCRLNRELPQVAASARFRRLISYPIGTGPGMGGCMTRQAQKRTRTTFGPPPLPIPSDAGTGSPPANNQSCPTPGADEVS